MSALAYSLILHGIRRGLVSRLAGISYARISIACCVSGLALYPSSEVKLPSLGLLGCAAISAMLFFASYIFRNLGLSQVEREDLFWTRTADSVFAACLVLAAVLSVMTRGTDLEYFSPSVLNGIQPGIWVFAFAIIAFVVSRVLLAAMLAGETEHREPDFFVRSGKLPIRQLANIAVCLGAVVLFAPMLIAAGSPIGRSLTVVLCLAGIVVVGNLVNGFRTLVLSLHFAWLAALSVYIDALATRANLEALAVLDLLGYSVWLPVLIVAVTGYLQISVLWNTYKGTTRAKHRETVFMTGQLLIFIGAGVASLVLVMLPVLWREVDWLKDIR